MNDKFTDSPRISCGDGSTAFPQGSGQSYQRKGGVWRGRRQGAI